MTPERLTTALRACAAGIYRAEAGVALLVGNGTFLRRDDFTARFIEHGTSGTTPMAAINWDAATTALNGGDLPCSGGERRILQLAASLAAGIPVSLRETISGLDNDNTARLLTAIRHASGRRADADLWLPHRHDGPDALFYHSRVLRQYQEHFPEKLRSLAEDSR
jgi:hypothetical protein